MDEKDASGMPRIDELSNEGLYTIKTVCAQTGIRSVTLRAWERRHNLLNPVRAENSYRLYSERDIALLRWIKNRVDNGLTISSAVNELRGFQKNNILPEALPTLPILAGSKNTAPPEPYARQLYQAFVAHDEPRALKLLNEVIGSFDLVTICMEVLIPCLTEIGEAWYHGKISVATEHFASVHIRGKLMTIMQALPTRRGAPFILVGCAPTEQHEIGSLMLAVMLSNAGFRVEYLGPDLPLDDLVDYARFEKPALICISATSDEAARALRSMQAKLKKVTPLPIFGYGGRAFNDHPALRQEIAGEYLGETLTAAVNKVRGLLA